MKLHRVFLIALMTGAFAVAGCGDSGGNGGVDASSACSGPICEANDVLRATCETGFDRCIETNPNEEECLVVAEATCGSIQ